MLAHFKQWNASSELIRPQAIREIANKNQR